MIKRKEKDKHTLKKSSLYTINFPWSQTIWTAPRNIFTSPLLAICKLIDFGSLHLLHILSPSTIEHLVPIALHYLLLLLSFLATFFIRTDSIPSVFTNPLENEKKRFLYHLQQVWYAFLSTSTIWMNLSIVDKQIRNWVSFFCSACLLVQILLFLFLFSHPLFGMIHQECTSRINFIYSLIYFWIYLIFYTILPYDDKIDIKNKNKHFSFVFFSIYPKLRIQKIILKKQWMKKSSTNGIEIDFSHTHTEH